MVPRLAKAGTSFKGAGLYYLHDKGRAATADRVAFTHVINCDDTNDPETALNKMAFTAINQDDLKKNYYIKTHPDDPEAKNFKRSGRPAKTTVMHYSLAWHPSEEPSREHMIEAAQETLRKLKLDEHQCVLVAHNDEPHPHIHVIVNKVHPVTGKIAQLKFTKRDLQDWAKAYELEHGKIWCEERLKEDRKQARPDAFDAAHNDNPKRKRRSKGDTSKSEYYRWRRQESEHNWSLDKAARATLWDDQKAMRKRLTDLRAADTARAKATVKEHMRPAWAAHFRQERDRRRNFDRQMKVAVKRLAYFLRNPDKCVQYEGGWLTPAWKAITSPQILREQFEKKMEADRTAIRDRHGIRARDAVRDVYNRHRDRIDALIGTQREQRQAQRQDQEHRAKERRATAPQRYREKLITDVVAEIRTKQDGTFRSERFRSATAPAPMAQHGGSHSPGLHPVPPPANGNPDAPARVHTAKSNGPGQAQSPPPQPMAHQQWTLPPVPPHAVRGGAKPPDAPSRQAAFNNASRRPHRLTTDPPQAEAQSERARPWTSYGVAPRQIPHPTGLRRPPVQTAQSEQTTGGPRSGTDRQTLAELRRAERRREDNELLLLFGTVGKAEKAKTRAVHGNSKSKGGASRGRVRKRGLE